MSKINKALKVATLSSAGFALLFAAFSLVLYFGEWERLIFAICSGLFIGLLAAPEIEPIAFKNAWLFQTICGAISGVFLALGFQLNIEAVLFASLVGALIGWSAPIWVKHVPIP
jgi:hypothetical protein